MQANLLGSTIYGAVQTVNTAKSSLGRKLSQVLIIQDPFSFLIMC